MSNYEYYKPSPEAVTLIARWSPDVVEWLYEEHNDKNTLKETAEALIREISMCGITKDTMATERLHRFIKALKRGNEEERKYGEKIESLDGTYLSGSAVYARQAAITYALIVIGHIFKVTDLFKEIDKKENF